jgi:hypothetical protein
MALIATTSTSADFNRNISNAQSFLRENGGIYLLTANVRGTRMSIGPNQCAGDRKSGAARPHYRQVIWTIFPESKVVKSSRRAPRRIPGYGCFSTPRRAVSRAVPWDRHSARGFFLVYNPPFTEVLDQRWHT